MYTYGKAIWVIGGNWITKDIEQMTKSSLTNDRTGYAIIYDIKNKVGDKSIERPAEKEFSIHDAFRQIIYDPKARKMQPASNIEDKAKKIIAKQYGITTEEVNQILTKVFTWIIQ